MVFKSNNIFQQYICFQILFQSYFWHFYYYCLKFLSQLRNLHDHLESPPKRAIDLENLLARVAKRRGQLNNLVSEVNGGIGPVVAASVFTLCFRLSFSLFTNFSMAAEIFSGKMPSLATMLILYPRTFFKSIVLVCLAHSGQKLADEVFCKKYLTKMRLFIKRVVGCKRAATTRRNRNN